jgi:hypothetical protein
MFFKANISGYGMIGSMSKHKKNPAAVALGRLGGRAKVPKGFAKLTRAQRREMGLRAAFKRWVVNRRRPKASRPKSLPFKRRETPAVKP